MFAECCRELPGEYIYCEPRSRYGELCSLFCRPRHRVVSIKKKGNRGSKDFICAYLYFHVIRPWRTRILFWKNFEESWCLNAVMYSEIGKMTILRSADT